MPCCLTGPPRETDGAAYHRSRADRHRDYQKMIDLTAAGLIVCRADEQMILDPNSGFGPKLTEASGGRGVVELQAVSPHTVAVIERGPP